MDRTDMTQKWLLLWFEFKKSDFRVETDLFVEIDPKVTQNEAKVTPRWPQVVHKANADRQITDSTD